VPGLPVPDTLGSGEKGPAGKSRQEFVELFKRHTQPKTVDLADNTLMPWGYFAKMTEDDLSAIYEFLATLPPQ
jgi:hypothetical protein